MYFFNKISYLKNVAKQIFNYRLVYYLLNPKITKHGSFIQDITNVFTKYNMFNSMEKIVMYGDLDLQKGFGTSKLQSR